MITATLAPPTQVALSSRSPFAMDDEPVAIFNPNREVAPAFKPSAPEPAPSVPQNRFATETPAPAPATPPARPPVEAPASRSPFQIAPEEESPFHVSTPPVPAPAPAAQAAPFSDVSPFQIDEPSPQPKPFQGAAPQPQPQPQPEAQAPAPVRQLALRAIFGIDRELGAEEMLERARRLTGIRHLARVSDLDAASVDLAREALGNLGFGHGPVQLLCGNRPVEFLREGRVLLAVQTDGSYAPGVRETLILVARELANL